MILQPTSGSPKIGGQVRQNKIVQNDRRPPVCDGLLAAPGDDHFSDTKEKLRSVSEEEEANGGMVPRKVSWWNAKVAFDRIVRARRSHIIIISKDQKFHRTFVMT